MILTFSKPAINNYTVEQGWKDLDLTLHCPKLLREEVFSEDGDTACDRATGISKISVGTSL